MLSTRTWQRETGWGLSERLGLGSSGLRAGMSGLQRTTSYRPGIHFSLVQFVPGRPGGKQIGAWTAPTYVVYVRDGLVDRQPGTSMVEGGRSVNCAYLHNWVLCGTRGRQAGGSQASAFGAGEQLRLACPRNQVWYVRDRGKHLQRCTPTGRHISRFADMAMSAFRVRFWFPSRLVIRPDCRS